jgi:hypothetical protein
MRLELLALALLAACGGLGSNGDASDGVTTDSDGNGDTDTDTDADSDTDTDTDGPSGGSYDLDCDADYLANTPPPGTPDGSCITQEVHCGDVIYHDTAEGSEIYDDRFWTDHFLTSTLEPGDLDGPERVYLFRDLGPGQTVSFDVYSCDPVWGSTIWYGDVSGDFCDTDDAYASAEHMIGAGTTTNIGDRINGTFTGSYDVIAIVDTYHGATTNFAMSVTCGVTN